MDARYCGRLEVQIWNVGPDQGYFGGLRNRKHENHILVDTVHQNKLHSC